jgi:preprotein translocase subunit SecG
MQSVLLVIQVLVTIALVVVVLLQRSEGGALGMGGGGGGLGGLFTPRGAGDALTRTTAILAILFFLSSLGLTLIAVRGRPEGTFLDSAPVGTTHTLQLPKPAQQPTGPQVPSVPAPR